MSRRLSPYKTEIRCMDYSHNGITCRVSFYNDDDTIEVRNDAGQEVSLSPEDLIPVANMLRAIEKRLRDEWRERDEDERLERESRKANAEAGGDGDGPHEDRSY